MDRVKETWLSRLVSHLRSPLYRNGYALVFNSGATGGLGLVYWVIAARLYPAGVVGLNSALLAAMQFLAGIALLSLNNVLLRFIPPAGRNTPRLIGSAYGLCLVTALVVGLGFTLGAKWWAPSLAFLGADPAWLITFVLSILLWCIFVLQDSALTGLRQAVWVPVENIAFGVVKIVLLVLLASTFPPFGIFTSWLLPVALTLLPVNLLIFRWLIPRHIQSTQSQAVTPSPWQAVKYGGSTYVGMLFSMASTYLLPILITNQAGAEANAYFSQPWLIALGLQLVAANMSTSLVVETAFDATQLRAYCRRVLVQLARLLVPLVGLVWLAAPYVLRAFGPSYAAEGSALLRWLALAVLPNGLVSLGVSVVRIQNRPGAIILVQGAQCGLILGLSAVLLPFYGITGVGIACLVGQTAVAAGLLVTVLRPIVQREPASSGARAAEWQDAKIPRSNMD